MSCCSYGAPTAGHHIHNINSRVRITPTMDDAKVLAMPITRLVQAQVCSCVMLVALCRTHPRDMFAPPNEAVLF